MKKLLVSFAAVALLGCSSNRSDRRFAACFGQQSNWPAAPGAFAKIVDGFSIFSYGQLPAKPYDVLGALPAADEQVIVSVGRRHGADAAVIDQFDRHGPGLQATWTANSASLNSSIFPKTKVRVLLIKYRS
ncbi:MAG TPA: hypothetical protein VGO59_19200 [Verrucomicrobiae bacterium]|jgi:hypothetical protein